MNNYEYIIASLPVISLDKDSSTEIDSDQILSFIKGQCSKWDKSLIEMLLTGMEGKEPDYDFYKKAISHKNRFIREYFNFDLLLRNEKVNYLNRELGRPAGTDIFIKPIINNETNIEKIRSVFISNDILGRESKIDSLMWNRISEINTFDLFNIESILGFIAKLHIVTRWINLDPESGKKMFLTLLKEIRGTFADIKYEG